MTLGEFICEYRSEHDLSQRQFALLCGVSNGYISMLEKGSNPRTNEPITPSLTNLQKIAKGMGISLDELLTRVENVYIDMAPDLMYSNIIPLPKTYSVPLIGNIACGEPILAIEDAEETVAVPEHVHADFALRCKGDSMINARIFDGDIVYIRRQDDVDDGEIAAVLIDDEATLKRVRKYSDHVSLEPANPMYQPLVYWGSDADSVHIIGKAVAFTSVVR